MVIDVQLNEKLKYYKHVVENAGKENKRYRLVCSGSTMSGVRNKLKAELIKRGFVEHVEIKKDSMYRRMSINTLCDGARDGNEFENVLLARLFDRQYKQQKDTATPNFIWLTGPQMKYFAYPRATKLNRIRFIGTNFTQKHGLCEYTRKINKQLQIGRAAWENACNRVTRIPRMYELTDDADLVDFEKDFNWSAAVSLVMFLNSQDNVQSWFNKRPYSLELDGIVLALRVVAHACTNVENGQCKVGQIDGSAIVQVHSSGWRKILHAQEALVKLRSRIHSTSDITTQYICNQIKIYAEKIMQFWPQHCYDGYQNIWIVKPAASGRGDSILVSDDKDKILRHLDYDFRRYIAQRYIERPLLVYGTKFDMRHYLLITIDDTCYRGWTHRDACDIKLCSSNFSLDDLCEQKHVTNTAVQWKYKNHLNLLPDNHMWSLQRLNEYFECIGHPNVYYERIFPQIKETLEQVCKQAISEIELTKGRFELFGCDWIITQDFTPYLLEVNRGPGLAHYTPVSVLANNQLIEDLVKGILYFTFFQLCGFYFF